MDLKLICTLLLCVFAYVKSECPPGWKSLNSTCYYITDQNPRRNYNDALQVCTARNATMWVPQSEPERLWVVNQTVLGYRILYWVGLRLVNHTWQWNDGTTYTKNSTHWVQNKEGNKNSGNTCAGLYSYPPYTGQIQQRRCGEGWGIICTRADDALDTCDILDGWHFINGRCYKYFDQKMNWFDARRTCQDNQGDLTLYGSNIHDYRQGYNQLLLMGTIVPGCRAGDNNFWIGLSDTVNPGHWMWVQNYTVRYTRFYSYSNKYLQKGNTCWASKVNNNFDWEVQLCNQKFNFICNRSEGVCPNGWLNNRDRCYQVTSVTKSRTTWFGAKQYCESQGTKLLVINDAIEDQFIGSTLRNQHVTRAWLGFSDLQMPENLTWIDGTVVKGGPYENWDRNFPQTNYQRFDCGIVNIGRSTSKWSNGYCFNYVSFVCEMQVTDKPYVPTQAPATHHCNPGWQLFNNNCYYFGPGVNQSMKTWQEASDYCQARSALLAILTDPYEISFVTVQQNKAVTAWIGLKWDRTQQKLFWVDGAAPGDHWRNETNFYPGEPDDTKHGQYCIQIVGGRTDFSGSWDDGNCNKAQGFICKAAAFSGSGPQTTPAKPPGSFSLLCGPDWIYDSQDSYCYQVVLNAPKTWALARSDCQQKGGDLVSITAREEQNFVQAILSTGIYARIQLNFWIGATDQDKEGGWEWIDGSPFAFLNWHPGEPDNRRTGRVYEDCSEIVPSWNYMWNDKKCSLEQQYICKKLPITPTPPTTRLPPLAINKVTCIPEPMISGNYSVVDSTAFGSSSYEDSAHAPQNGRWYLGSLGSWSAKTNDNNQYVSVSFYSTIVVKKIVTAGRADRDDWISQYKIQYREDYYSDWLTYNDPPGVQKVFTGNTDAVSPVTNTIQFPFEAKSVKLIPVRWHQSISLRWEILGCMEEDCSPDYALSGPLIAPDSAFSASSQSDTNHAAKMARVRPIVYRGRANSWRPRRSDINQWIQVDLGSVVVVRGIVTYGNPSSGEWVRTYKVQYQIYNTSTPKYYNEPFNRVKTLQGNRNNRSPSTHYFKSHFQARYIKILPVTWYRNIALRFDVLVCPQGCKGTPLISGTNPISDDSLNASSSLNNDHGPSRSRLNLRPRVHLSGGWFAKYTDHHQYIQVDLGSMIQITAVATQGSANSADWIKSYKITYSDDGKKWYSTFNPLVFLGNWDQYHVRKNYITIPFIARFVRLWPMGWNHRIVLRWELYGCPGADSGISIGCYADDPSAPDLAYEPYSDPNVGMWPPMCIHYCFRKGYYYAGVQAQYKCFCGNSYGRYGQASDCTQSCFPRSRFMCGGPKSNLIYTTGLSADFKTCPPKWKAYKDYCYLLLLDARSVDDARRDCKLLGGDLASPNNQNEQDFAFSLLQLGGGKDAWIGLNRRLDPYTYVWTSLKPVMYTNWSPNPRDNRDKACVVMDAKTGGWKKVFCSDQNEYICQMDKQPSASPSKPPLDAGCDRGWSGYRWSCYQVQDAPRTWSDAKKVCQSLGSSLVRIEDRYEQAYLSSLLGTRSLLYWSDLSDSASMGNFQFSDTSRYVTYTNWAANKPDVAGHCVALGSRNSTGLWTNIDCATRTGAICETNRIGYTTPTKPPTTTPATTCATGWVPVNGSCFQINQRPPNKQLPWTEALEFCVSQSASLASFHSADELDAVWRNYLVGTTYSYWIGLNDRAVESGYVWTDGSPVNFVAWDDNEPNNFKGQEDCIELKTESGKWNDHNCGWYRNWICKANKGATVAPPATYPAPTPGPDSKCAPEIGWKYYNNYCYIVKDGAGDLGKSWREARRWCHQFGGELASIHSMSEEQFIYQRLLANVTTNAVWIGMNEIDWDRGYRWSDGTQADFTFWGKDEPNGWRGAEDCVEMTARNGKWNDAHCSLKSGFACKKLVGATPTPFAPTPIWRGNCPAGFHLLGNRCFRVYTDSSNWTTARDKCAALGKGYNLASIFNDIENAFLITILAEISAAPWIGMFKDSTNKLFWVDNHDVTYTNWARGEPNGGHDEGCVQLTNSGTWNDNRCSRSLPYVCETLKKASILTPEPTPNPCDAKQGFFPFENGCYQYISQKMSWQNASANCNSMGAFLVSIVSPAEQSFIYILSNQKQANQSQVQPVWLGLSDQQQSGVYSWVDKWPVLYTNWDVGEPTRGINEGCVMFNSSGMWSDVQCNMTMPSVCKITSAKPPLTPPPPNGTCGGQNWYSFGTNCYAFYPNDYRSFFDAKLACQERQANLVSIHNQTVNDYLVNMTKSLTLQSQSFWTSLHRSLDAGFIWVDSTPLQYVNWRHGEPSLTGWSGNAENCVEVFLDDGKWNDEDCTSSRGFICEKLQDVDANLVSIGTTYKVPTRLPNLTPPLILPSQLVPTIKKTSSVTHSIIKTPFTLPSQRTPVMKTKSTTLPPSKLPPVTFPTYTGTVNGSATPTAVLLYQTEPGSGKSMSPSAIAGVALGGVVVLVIIISALMFWRKKTPSGAAANFGITNPGYESNNIQMAYNAKTDEVQRTDESES